MLPDTATIHGRLYLGAWDAGLDNVADDTVNFVQYATEVLKLFSSHLHFYLCPGHWVMSYKMQHMAITFLLSL